MEDQNKKCSSSKHKDIDAVSYCQQCQKYFCKKCKNIHTEILEDHILIDLNKKNEVFVDICKVPNHPNKLEFFCKQHNSLCCLACISKIKDKGYGQHHDCDVCNIKNINEEKRNILKENINNLEELNKKIENYINELKLLNEEINKNKEDLKIKVQQYLLK